MAILKKLEAYKRAQVINSYVISKGHLKLFALMVRLLVLGMFARHKAGGYDILYGMIVRYYRARIAVAIQRGTHTTLWDTHPL